ncbi:hypothetical protein [Acutalibacter caecimuris]|uniref:hypothetical protein n=1 Tax=Acutalibacter caecimuris TaxID=3093657 RepID=UPI002AC9A572|nr:hypothetical protein [Acutalibacter sp. M00118]
MEAMDKLLDQLNRHYSGPFQRLELLRDSGSLAYAAFSGGEKYFLRVVKPALVDTAMAGADVQIYLQARGFPVPPIQLTKTGAPYVRCDEGLIVLYAFIEGEDAQPERDAEAAGALVGRLHREMRATKAHWWCGIGSFS